MRNAVINAALLLGSIVVALVGCEIGIRLLSGGGTVWEWRNYVADQEQWAGRWTRMRPDPGLGYIPRAGYRDSHMSFGADGLRLHHQDKTLPDGAPAPILVVGDSYAMGAEVDDDATWPAFLQATLGRRVLNAGVPGYGIDQVVLRAEQLVPRYKPATLIVGLIADDVERARMHILWGLKKPYFTVEDGRLVLRSVPLAEPALDPELDTLRAVLGYSYLMDVAMRRLGYMAWWRRGQPSHIEPAHDDGEKVACLLMGWLAAIRDRHGIKLVLVAQYSRQAWETADFQRKEVAVIKGVIACARAQKLDTIDSFDAVAAAVKAHGIDGAYVGIHMNPSGNRLTADLIAEWLKAHH